MAVSKRIRGITVEIGGDTTKLGSALKDVDSSARGLQSELRGVESLLKMDPSSVTLIKQKQDVLNESIATTKDRLNVLKSTQADVQAQFERGEITEQQYRDFQREIINTENKLKSLEDQAKSFGSTASAHLLAASEKVGEFGAKVEDAGKKFAPVSAAAAGVLTGAGFLAVNFEDSMAKVNTIADTSVLSLNDLEQEIINLSNTTGVGANDIAEATYNAISAGQDTADAVGFVENATRLARAGFTDTDKALDVLTTTLNAYKMESEDASKVSDVLLQTQNLGKVTVDELSSSMGKIIPTANANNVAFEQLGTGYAIMTSNGISAAESTTYMNSMLNELGKGGSSVDKILREKTGKSFAELSDEGHSMGDVLEILKDEADANGQAFTDLWGSSEAGKAALTLLGDGADDFNDTLAQMYDSTGATDKAFEKLETTSYDAKIAFNQIKNSMMDLGQVLMTTLAPVLSTIFDAIKRGTEWFNGLSDGVKTTIVILLGLIAAIAPVLIVVGRMARGLSDILLVAAKLKPVFLAMGGAISLPVVLIVAGIAAIVAIFVVLWNKSDAFREFWINLWNIITESALKAWQWIKETWDKAIPFFIEIWEKIKETFSVVAEVLTPYFKSAWEAIKAVWDVVVAYFKLIWENIKAIFSVVKSVLTGDFQGAWDGIKRVFANVGAFFGSVWDSIKRIFQAVVPNSFKKWFSDAWRNVKNVFSGVGSFFGGIWTTIKNKFTDLGTKIGDAIGSSFKGAMNSALRTVENAVNKGIGLINGAITLINKLPMVNVGKVAEVSLPRLRTGGVLEEGQAMVAEANSPEMITMMNGKAVVTPLTQSQKTKMINRDGGSVYANDDSQIVGRLDKMIGVLNSYLNVEPNYQIVMDNGVLVGQLIDGVDKGLSNKAQGRVRGR